MPLVTGAAITALMMLIVFLVRNATPRRAGDEEEVARQSKVRSSTERILIFTSYFTAAAFCYIAVRPVFASSDQLNLAPFLSFTFGGVAVLIIASNHRAQR